MELIRRDYFANEGWETFLSYEDPEQDILVGLLRLRKPSNEAFRFDKDRTFESFTDATAESYSYTTTEKNVEPFLLKSFQVVLRKKFLHKKVCSVVLCMSFRKAENFTYISKEFI